jgi:hypothetical protein
VPLTQEAAADLILTLHRNAMRARMRIRAPKDFWSGVMFCGFAAVAVFSARGTALGTAGKMGPG